jgi:hypothetical protein
LSRIRTFFIVSCAFFASIIPLSCGEDVAPPPDCGVPTSTTDLPETPGFGDHPVLTNKPSITLSGTKAKNASVAIGINNADPIAAVTFDCLTTWATDVSLSEGPNSLEIFSTNRTGGKGPSTTISITLDLTKPSSPTIDQCSTIPCIIAATQSPFTLSGPKQAGEAVFIKDSINDRLVVEASSATSWSYDVSLTAATGDNSFEVKLQDAAGNKSDPKSVTVTFSGSPATPPNLFSPLGNSGVVTPQPVFIWDGAGGGTFCIQVSDSVSFPNEDKNCNNTLDPGEDSNINGVLDTPIVNESTSLVPFSPSTSIPVGRYFWRVGRINGSDVFFGLPRKIFIGKSLCDLNGDGFDDIVVGAYGNDTSGPNAGKVYIYYGGLSFNNVADVILTGEIEEDRFGISVACAGDLNNDGYSDLIAGAYQNDAAEENAGRAYIFFGGPTLNTKSAASADRKLTGQAAGDQFGLFVSTAGDVNGDGFDDVIAGAYRNDGEGSNAGRAYIYYGGSNMDNIPDVVLTGQAPEDQFGIRVAWAGDINGDTYDDVIIGADGSDVGNLINAGRAYIFFGSPNMAGRNASHADVILEAETADDAFASVGGAGDVNNDGYSDILVGASAHKITSANGEKECFNGIDDDSDGLTDSSDPDCQPVGQAYLFLGSGLIPNNPSTPLKKSASVADLTLTGESVGDALGFAVSTAGDLNGDGYADLLVGAFGSDGTATDGTAVLDMGKAYIYYGGGTLNAVADFTITGQASVVCSDPDISINNCPPEKKVPLSGQFGFSVAKAGDVNGDGSQDIIIGSYLWDEGIVTRDPVTQQVSFIGTDKGRVYLFPGPASTFPLPPSPFSAETFSNTIKLTGETGNDGFGISAQ